MTGVILLAWWGLPGEGPGGEPARKARGAPSDHWPWREARAT